MRGTVLRPLGLKMVVRVKGSRSPNPVAVVPAALENNELKILLILRERIMLLNSG